MATKPEQTCYKLGWYNNNHKHSHNILLKIRVSFHFWPRWSNWYWIYSPAKMIRKMSKIDETTVSRNWTVSNSGLWPFRAEIHKDGPTSMPASCSGGHSLNNSKVMQREVVLLKPLEFVGRLNREKGVSTQGSECGGPWPRTGQRAEATWRPRSQAVPPAAGLPQSQNGRTLLSSWGYPARKEETPWEDDGVMQPPSDTKSGTA